MKKLKIRTLRSRGGGDGSPRRELSIRRFLRNRSDQRSEVVGRQGARDRSPATRRVERRRGRGESEEEPRFRVSEDGRQSHGGESRARVGG